MGRIYQKVDHLPLVLENVDSCDLSPMESKDLSRVKPGFKSVPLQFYFEIAGLANAKKWNKIQKMVGEERY